jgi:hypothetical protein
MPSSLRETSNGEPVWKMMNQRQAVYTSASTGDDRAKAPSSRPACCSIWGYPLVSPPDSKRPLMRRFVAHVTRCPMSNTKIATMFGSHGGWGKRRLAVPGGRVRWSDGCCFAAETARNGRGRPSAERPRQRRGCADRVRARRVVGCLRVPDRLSLQGKFPRTALRESGKPSASAAIDSPE